MPSKTKSIFLKKPKKKKFKATKKPQQVKPVKRAGDAIKNSINQASAVSIHIQQLLDTTFQGAPPSLRSYLTRADNEIRDLIKLLVTKFGGTEDADQITVQASALLEEFAEQDPEFCETLAGAVEAVQDTYNV